LDIWGFLASLCRHSLSDVIAVFLNYFAVVWSTKSLILVTSTEIFGVKLRQRDAITYCRGLILGPVKPADMIKYMPFRQRASVTRQNQPASADSASKDDVTAHSEALKMAPDSPEGASSVSVYTTQNIMSSNSLYILLYLRAVYATRCSYYTCRQNILESCLLPVL